MTATPRATAAALIATLAVTATALASFLATAPNTRGARPYLILFAALFALRVLGQIAAIAYKPDWLPAPASWNFVPYPLLLPTQLALLALIGSILTGRVNPGPGVAGALVVGAFVYWSAMAARYARRMAKRPDQRWFGGAIPIVFHCVLAAFVFVLGASHAA